MELTALDGPADKIALEGFRATENNLMVVDADRNAIFVYLLFHSAGYNA